MAYTLAQLRLLCQQRADMENSTFIQSSEWNNYINDSYAELYDLLTAQFEDYFISDPVNFTLSATNTYSLPSDFYKIRGLDYNSNGVDWIDVKEFNFAERNRVNGINSRYGISRRYYRILGQKLYILPELQAPGLYRLWYIPRFTKLSNDSDVMGDVLDFAEYVIIDAAMKAMIKEESDISPLMAQKQAMTERVITMASDRSVDAPERVADTMGQFTNYDFLFPRG